MTGNLFFVAPSEAMLIGLCLGEYLRRRTTEPRLSFLDVINSRLQPFMADSFHVLVKRIETAEIPNDIQWFPISGVSLGRSNLHPRIFYGIDACGAYKKRIDFRKSFATLLVCHLSPHLGMSKWLREFIGGVSETSFDEAAIAQALFVALANASQDADELDVGQGGNDNPREIEDAIRALIQYNEVQQLCLVGEMFGVLIAAVTRYESGDNFLPVIEIMHSLRHLLSCDYVERTDVAKNAINSVFKIFKEEITSLIPILEVMNPLAELIEKNRSVGCEVADQLSERVADFLDDETIAHAKDVQLRRRDAVLPTLKNAVPAIWVAFGEILGMIRESDQVTRDQDEASDEPRSRIERNDTPDRIRTWLADYEAELSQPKSTTPEKVVIGLKDSIEALTKRLWKKEVAQVKSLQQFLADRMRRGSVSEMRFAKVAFTLHGMYRNTGTHEQDSFKCSIHEAWFFVSGIRVLLDFYTEIDATRL